MNSIAHFAIHADDVERARTFYERVFDWSFEPWGPPGFYLIRTPGEGGIHGSLQGRSEPLQGTGLRAFECTVAVEELDAIAAGIAEAGGQVVMPPMTIPNVGRMLKFEDTEGNIACAMQYVEGLA